MKESGINVNIYGSHLTRSASTSKCRIIENQQNGQMKTRLHKFVISQFKRTFQTIYLDEICCFLYVYMVLFIQERYMVLIIHELILIRLRKSLDY